MRNVQIYRIFVIWSRSYVSEGSVSDFAAGMENSGLFLLNASLGFSILLPSPSPDTFLLLFSQPARREVWRFTYPGHFGLFGPGKPLWALQAVPVLRSRSCTAGVPPGDLRRHLGLDPRLPAQPSRAGSQLWVCRCFTRTRLPWLMPSVGNLLLFWSQGFSKVLISGVPPWGRCAVWPGFSDSSFPSGLGPGPSSESSCHGRNDNVLCTSESFTPSSCPLLSEFHSSWDLFEVQPSWQPWGSIFTGSSNSRLPSFVSPCHLLVFFPLQTVSKVRELPTPKTHPPIKAHLHQVHLNDTALSVPNHISSSYLQKKFYFHQKHKQ